MNKKLIWGVIIIIILAGIGWLVWSFNTGIRPPQEMKNNSVTADWKTYKNYELGYEIRYPKNFSVSDESNDYVSLLNPKYPGKDGTDIPYEYVRIQISKNDCAQHDWTRGGSPAGDVTDSYKTICFDSNKKLSVQAFAMEDSSKAIYDGILSTFKFTSPTSAIKTKTTDWKTYSNNTSGFSFQYPSDWIVSESAFEGEMVGVIPPGGQITNVIDRFSIEVVGPSQPGSPQFVCENSSWKESIGTDYKWLKTRCIGDLPNSFIGLYATTDDVKKSLEQILSTFKFTK